MAKVMKVLGLNPDKIYVLGKLVEFDANGIAEVKDKDVLEELRKIRTHFIVEDDEKEKDEKEPEEHASEEKEEAPKKRTRKKAE